MSDPSSTLTIGSLRDALVAKYGEAGLRARLSLAEAALRRDPKTLDPDPGVALEAVRAWIGGSQ